MDSIEVLSAEMRQAVSDAAAAVLPKHDQLCAINDGQVWCDCAVINRVREDERARAVEIVDHFFMDRETEQRIKSAIGDGAICTCPSESCPIAWGD